MTTPTSFSDQSPPSRFPVLTLLHPREYAEALGSLLALGLLLGVVGMRWFELPLWGATVVVLALVLPPVVLKWRADLRRFGSTAMVIGILLSAQGFHMVEHVAQWVEFHVLRWPFFKASGLISPLNAEWIHFLWNWSVVAASAYLVIRGMRNVWGGLLLAWAVAHSLEHTYMLFQYLDVLSHLQRMGVTGISAQGLPGILGRDGWLATSPATQGTFLSRLPGLATAPRLDIHFWWNAGETVLLFLAAQHFLPACLEKARTAVIVRTYSH